jgi:hypothetical protein
MVKPHHLNFERPLVSDGFCVALSQDEQPFLVDQLLGDGGALGAQPIGPE